MALRLPWQRDEGAQGDDVDEGTLDDEEGTEGGEGDEEAEIPPETQALIDRARQEERTRISEAAARHGMAWTGDDLGVTDYNRLAGSLGFQQQQQAQQPAQQQQQQAAGDEDPEPEFEDAYDVEAAKAHSAWQARQAAKGAQAELQATREMLNEERLSRAMDRVEDAVKKHAPHLTEYLDHPDFAEAFPQALATQHPTTWGDTRTLARLVGALSIDMDRERLPKKEDARARDEAGRYTMGEQQRRQLSQVSSSRESGRVPQDDQDEDDVRTASRYLGIPPAQVRAARHHSIEDWRRERAAAKDKGSRR